MMDFLEKLKKSLIANSILRNSIVILIAVLCLLAAGAAIFDLKVILFVVSGEMLAILLSGLAIFAISHYSVAEKLIRDVHYGKTDIEEQRIAADFTVRIVQSVHILVGMLMVAYYFKG